MWVQLGLNELVPTFNQLNVLEPVFCFYFFVLFIYAYNLLVMVKLIPAPNESMLNRGQRGSPSWCLPENKV